jgi:eukaryotic-like serine/threonine-protein kinase
MLNSEAVAEHVSASSGRIAPFGKYLLLQRVSVGGMAEVFKALPATADRIDQIVAIKRILPNIAEDSEFIGMFIDEARIAGQLHHPNICRIYELGRVNNDHYIAMQFLWGRDLLKLMNRYKKAGRFVSPLMVAFIGSKALSALHYAHTKVDEEGRPLHIIHRDVSPQNIIVGYSGQVKLIDFGVARAASQSQKTQAGILKGKFGYMSPEMIRGLPIDHRSDVFAMGICLHELLTSTRLFYGETDFATLELVRDANVVPPSAKAPDVPPELDAIVMKALAREANDRFQSAEEMQRALEGFLAGADPHYGQSAVGMAMRQAFHTEVQRERERLELFWGMLERGELVRGAAVPSSPHETDGGGGRSAAPSPVAAILEASDAPDPGIKAEPVSASGEEDLQDEQTHIFFSASELQELQEIESAKRQPEPKRNPTLSDMIPPPPAERLQTLPPPTGARYGSFPPVGATGTYQRDGAPPAGAAPSLFDQAYAQQQAPGSYAPNTQGSPFDPARPDPTYPTTVAQRTLETLPIQARQPRVARYVVLALLAVTVATAAYAVPRFAAAGTGSLEVESTGDPDALVRVDGIVRGNPPIVVEGLTPGIHRVEVEATGFELARADVNVVQGQARAINLVLEKSSKKAQVAATEPALPSSPSAPATGSAGAPQITELPSEAAPATEKPREKRPHAPRRAVPNGAGSSAAADALTRSRNADPAVAESGGSETQVAEEVNIELAATNEGELLISTVPWSHVLVDGEDSGRDTPVRALRVPAGKHKIGLRTPDEVLHEVDVDVRAGQVVRIIRRF